MSKLLSFSLVALLFLAVNTNSEAQTATRDTQQYDSSKLPLSVFRKKQNGLAEYQAEKPPVTTCSWSGWTNWITLSNQSNECCVLKFRCESGKVTGIWKYGDPEPVSPM